MEAIKIGRAAHAAAALIQHMRVNHRRSNITVAEKFLNGADVISGFDQVRPQTSAGRCEP